MGKLGAFAAFVIACAFFWFCISEQMQLTKSQSWHVTSAEITKVSANPLDDGVYTRNNILYTFNLEIAPKTLNYKYSVGHKNYVGEQVFPMSGRLFHVNEGDLTSVRYDPAQPGESILSNEMLEHIKKMLILGGISLVGALCLCALPSKGFGASD